VSLLSNSVLRFETLKSVHKTAFLVSNVVADTTLRTNISVVEMRRRSEWL
jgi:hypothetical protein